MAMKYLIFLLFGISCSVSSVLEKRVECLYNNKNNLCILNISQNPVVRYLLIRAVRNVNIQCRITFRYERWDCTYNKKTFLKVTRESAFLYAALSASISITLTKECLRQKIQNCSDQEMKNQLITRHLLGISKNGDLLTQVINHNTMLGFKSLANLMETKCKCHGVSGSCVHKTCWPTVPALTVVLNALKMKYHLASTISLNNRVFPKLSHLVYFHGSDDHCKSTSGKICKDPLNCDYVCCNRGFDISEFYIETRCKCAWEDMAKFKIGCKICLNKHNLYTCK